MSTYDTLPRRDARCINVVTTGQSGCAPNIDRFLAAMQEAGWNCEAMQPEKRYSVGLSFRLRENSVLGDALGMGSLGRGIKPRATVLPDGTTVCSGFSVPCNAIKVCDYICELLRVTQSECACPVREGRTWRGRRVRAEGPTRGAVDGDG